MQKITKMFKKSGKIQKISKITFFQTFNLKKKEKKGYYLSFAN